MPLRTTKNFWQEKFSTSYLVLLGSLLLLLFLIFSAVSIVPKEGLTAARAAVLERRIQTQNSNGLQLPGDLGELPELENYDNSIYDGWGNKFIIRGTSEKFFLISYGPDKVVDTDDDIVSLIDLRTTITR